MTIIKKSTQVAMGGLAAALALLLMFMTGLVPFATYAMPALAGMVLIAIVVENGPKCAVVVYVAVSLLSVFISPDREAALMFIAFFGYYPILKAYLERIRPRALEYAVKFAIFNAAVILAYLFIFYLFGLEALLEGTGDLGMAALGILLIMGNVMFALYDFALTRIITLYVRWFRVKFLRRF